ncbi:hypothetical protein JXB37_08365 [candidate division WOR-3 bacterium]|nr:hypothetical protein [candidate division WOR-3 bacterium]
MRLRMFLALAALVAAAAAQLPGVVDTVGGTTFDNQNSGPSLRMLYRDPQFGIHVAWTFSVQPGGSQWPDRTMYYNFYDYGTGEWNWVEPDYMNSGMNSQTRRTGYGTIDVDPADGAALVTGHYSAGGMPPEFCPTVQRDLAPGSGLFDECVGAPTLAGYFLPVVGVDASANIHLQLVKFQASDNLYYSRSTFWCTWDDPEFWNQSGAYGHNLTASHASEKVLATWMIGNDDSTALRYRFSSDAGASWDPVTELTPYPAYGGDTLTVGARGASVIFDRDDNWLLVTTLLPVVGDTAYQNPAQLWMYNSGTAEWRRVRRAESHALAGGLGSHAAICDRPSLGQDPASGRLYCAWEEFDSTNVEPSTGLLRADVWLAWSDDGGANWSQPQLLAPTDETSKRFPHVGADCSGDSVAVGWVQDVIAGFNVDEVGAVSDNPVCVWHGRVTGIAEQPGKRVERLGARPNPFRAGTAISLQPAGRRPETVSIYDAAGNLVRVLAVGRDPSAVVWDGRDGSGREVQPGCYLARWRVGNSLRTGKLVKAR